MTESKNKNPQKRHASFQEKRGGPDVWLQSLGWLAFVGWALVFVALVFWDKARPQVQTLIDDLVGAKQRQYWDVELAQYIFYFMIFGVLISGVGLLINLKRNRRKKDSYRLSLILLGSVSVFGVVTYLFFLK